MWFMATVFDEVYTRYYQLVQRLAMGWTVQGWNLGVGEIFHTCPDWSWGRPSLLYNGCRVFPGDKADGAWQWPPTPSNAEVNRLKAELNPICHLLALLGAHPIFHVSRIRVKQRVGLYFYSPSGPLWAFLGWNLLLPLPLIPIHNICTFSDITAVWVLFHQGTISIRPLFYLANVTCHLLQIWSNNCSLVPLHFLSNPEL